uniref:Uncharacterized protein n=1 Tax=Glossina pallidipes TaxID=7398 RepID=A0A1A9ZUE1_GLOPL
MCASTQHLQLVENLSTCLYCCWGDAYVKATVESSNAFYAFSSIMWPLQQFWHYSPDNSQKVSDENSVSNPSIILISSTFCPDVVNTSSDNADIAVDVGTSVSAYTNVCLLKLFTLLKCSAAHTSRRIDWSHECYEN